MMLRVIFSRIQMALLIYFLFDSIGGSIPKNIINLLLQLLLKTDPNIEKIVYIITQCKIQMHNSWTPHARVLIYKYCRLHNLGPAFWCNICILSTTSMYIQKWPVDLNSLSVLWARTCLHLHNAQICNIIHPEGETHPNILEGKRHPIIPELPVGICSQSVASSISEEENAVWEGTEGTLNVGNLLLVPWMSHFLQRKSLLLCKWWEVLFWGFFGGVGVFLF